MKYCGAYKLRTKKCPLLGILILLHLVIVSPDNGRFSLLERYPYLKSSGSNRDAFKETQMTLNPSELKMFLRNSSSIIGHHHARMLVPDLHMNQKSNEYLFSSRFNKDKYLFQPVTRDIEDFQKNGNNSKHETQYYYLGYSRNPFGSYSEYIESMTADVDFQQWNYNLSDQMRILPRKKRSIVHLYSMVLCATGCDPLSYKGYGCYCGFLGSGYAVDGIDRCCEQHDWCYHLAGCPTLLEYFIPYLWKCNRHHFPLCVVHRSWLPGVGSCARKLCECDRRLARCLSMHPCPSTKALCISSPWRLMQNVFMVTQN